MRTAARAATLAVTTVVAAVGLATPAPAASWVYHSSHGHWEQCAIVGRAGLANQSWQNWHCLTIRPDTIGIGQYDLRVLLP